MTRLGLVLLLAMVAAGPVLAQSVWVVGEGPVERLAALRELRAGRSVQKSAGGSVAGGIAGGLAGGAVGFFGGLWVGGALVDRNCEVEDLHCLLVGLGIGAGVGESLLLPLGLHLGYGRRGNLGLQVAGSVALAGLGLAAVALTHEPAVLIPVPVLQLVVGLAAAGN
ncbi:MAG: hypothetical protein KatS3mg081_2660 [Gemmatimonadales bacterium]|nr:MAG: hypothetical protein KatS3mg081_2660 [Gemmatimonadales bacterium]